MVYNPMVFLHVFPVLISYLNGRMLLFVVERIGRDANGMWPLEQPVLSLNLKLYNEITGAPPISALKIKIKNTSK